MKNPSILITGASSGLGKALALAYAAPGTRLLLIGRSAKRLKEVAAQCREMGSTVITQAIDVTQAKALAAWITKQDKAAPISLVIANAGISAGTGGKGSILAEGADQALHIFETNLMGVLNTLHPVIPHMQKREQGQIAIISSLAGFRGLPGAPSYSASKAAVKAYGEALRGTLKPAGVGVTVICPGYIETPMTAVNDFPMPQLMRAEKAANIIKCRLVRNPALIAFPAPLSWVVRLVGALPCWLTDPLFERLPKKKAGA
jgi:short-subunit dehydrogenase